MHEPFMQAALQQAWLGRGMTAPNPAVGAVAVSNGKIIAQASHSGSGQPHAEQLLCRVLPDDCSNIVLYVTLEPCNHWGRTPPCVDALIQKRFKQVVYGYHDPNPLVSENNTPALLAAAGIEVLHYPLLAIDAFYESYAFWIKTGRPWVTVKIAQSFDGKIAGENGVPVQLSNKAAFHATHQARKYTDVILTTRRTIQKDNPALNARIDNQIISKPIAVIDNAQQLTGTEKIYQTAKKIHVYHHQSLLEILTDLGRIGYHDVWVEAGGNLFTALHRQKLAQRTILYLVPNSLGHEATSLYGEAGLLSAPARMAWDILEDTVQANFRVTLDWPTEIGESTCSV